MQHLMSIAKDPLGIVNNGLRHLAGKPNRIKANPVHLEIQTEQVPNIDSYVGLSEERDALVMPRAKLHWALTNQDKHTMVTMAHVMKRELEHIKLGTSTIEDWLASAENSYLPTMVGGHHHMGTTVWRRTVTKSSIYIVKCFQSTIYILSAVRYSPLPGSSILLTYCYVWQSDWVSISSA